MRRRLARIFKGRGEQAGPINWLNRASLRLRFNQGQIDPRVLCGRTTTGMYWNSTGTLQTAAIGVPRLTYDPANLSAPPGLLAEEARTNSIRNSTMQGAVAGTPGTLPTNWSVLGAAQGLTRTIVGTGTEDGITYMDVRWQGTLTSALSSTVMASPEPGTSVVAANGQIWTGTWFVRIVGGSLDNFSNLQIQITERTSAGSLVASASAAITPTGSPLSQQRYSLTRTLSGGATVERITWEIRSNAPSGATIDITLRIGLPQLELGASASSPIPTSGTAATRGADNLSMTNMSWYSAAGGVLYVDWVAGGRTNFVCPVALGSSILNGGVVQFRRGGSGNLFAQSVTAGGVQAQIPIITGAPVDGTRYKAAFRFAQNNFAATANGGAVGTDTLGDLPPSIGTLVIGNGWNSATATPAANEFLHGIIREIAFIPNPGISDGALQALTR